MEEEIYEGTKNQEIRADYQEDKCCGEWDELGQCNCKNPK